MNAPVLRLPRQDSRWSEAVRVTNPDGGALIVRPRDVRACSVSVEETEQGGAWEAGRPAIRQERVSDELTISGRRVIVPVRRA